MIALREDLARQGGAVRRLDSITTPVDQAPVNLKQLAHLYSCM